MTDKERFGCDCGCMGFGPLLSEVSERLGPSGPARDHFRTARIEFLKGLRALVDARIEHLSSAGNKPSSGTSVPVE